MNILPKILKLSNDLLLVIDISGNCLEIGKHFQDILVRQGVLIDELHGMIKEAFPSAEQRDTFALPLTRYGIYASEFTILHKAKNRLAFLAEDREVQHHLDELQKNTDKQRHSKKDKRVHLLLDESSDPIFSFLEDGTYLYVNKIFAQTLGYSQDDIIGKKIWDIFSKDEADKRFTMVRKVFLTGKTDNIEVRVPLPDGDKYFLTTVKPIKDESQKVAFIICISKDITELRETQNQLKSLKGILPICSNCKNIRNDKGAWQKLEHYISNHSDAEFSHGICPDCAQILYPNIYDRS